MGTVTEIFGNNPSVVLIQDAHGEYQAQQNIKSLLEFLNSKQKISTLLIEGGIGKLHPELLRFFKEETWNQKASEILAREAEIGGPELFLEEKGDRKSVV